MQEPLEQAWPLSGVFGSYPFTTQPDRFAFLMWLYRQAFADEVAPSALFRAAHRQLLARRILLPGQTVLTRLIASVRERATHWVHTRLAQATPPELQVRLEKLLLVPQGQRRSELDLLRRPPFTSTITGLVRTLDRLDRIRCLGAGDWTCPGSHHTDHGSGPQTKPGPPNSPTSARSGGSPP